MEFQKHDDGEGYTVIAEAGNPATTLGTLHKGHIKQNEWRFDPTNFCYNAKELEEISNFMKGLS